MDSEIVSRIEYVGSLIDDLESLPLPWSEIEIATFQSEWLDGVGVMNKLKLQIPSHSAEYVELVERYRNNHDKIIELRLAYPKID